MKLPVIVIGAGGHSKVVADALRTSGRIALGFLEANLDLHGRIIDGLKVLGCDDLLLDYPPETINLANGIGSTVSTEARRTVYERLNRGGYKFETVYHPSATIAQSAQIFSGVQIMAGGVIQPGVIIGENTIINTGAIVDHDCIIGKHCHIAPGVVLSGEVQVGDGCHIGTGADVIQGLSIGAGSLVAAGAVVIQDVPPNTWVAGVPARIMEII
ncbi:MAG: acetyltransferase [Desulfomonilaceae bacterium]|jgi:UDP-perosamine 4-acetyltransferase